MRGADLLGFVFGAHCCDDGVALIEELFEDVRWGMLDGDFMTQKTHPKILMLRVTS